MDEIRAEGAVAALGAATGPVDVVHDGKTWRIGHPTQRAKAELEKLVVAVSEQSLADLKDVLTAARYAAKEKRLDELVYARQWQTWGELWSQVVNGPLSFPLFLLSLMKAHHETATVQDAEALWLGANRACRTALTMVLPGFFKLLVGALPADQEERRVTAEAVAAELLEALQKPLIAPASTTPSP